MIFSTAAERHKKPGILNSQEVKSDFDLKMLNFDMGLTSYLTCLEAPTNHCSVNGDIYLSYSHDN